MPGFAFGVCLECPKRSCIIAAQTASSQSSIIIPDIMTRPVSAGGDKDKQAEKQTKSECVAPHPAHPADPISQSIGEFGRWQFLLTFLLSLVNFPCTFHIFAPTFEGAQRDFWCARPPGRNVAVDTWKSFSGIFDIDKDGNAIYDPCRVKDVIVPLSINRSEIVITYSNDSVPWKKCLEWEYNMTDFGKTIISEWNLVCENQQLSNIAEMMFLLGVAIGGLASGFFSDRLGRKNTLMVSLLLQIVLGLSIAFVPWLSLYLVLRALLGFVCVSVVFSGFVLCMELVGGKWLTISGVSYLFPLPLAYIVISAIAYYIRDWRNLQVAITVPAIPFLLLWWVLPESPRWLLTMGRVEETMNVLKEAAQVNRMELPPDTHKLLSRSISKVEMSESPKVGFGDLFRTPRIRKISLVLYVVWFTVYLIYYGVVLNLSSLGGNIYINSIISGAVEFPAIAISILFLLKMGRRWPLCLTVIGAGISCLLTIPVPKDFHWLKITFAMAAKFCISSSNVVMPVYTAELFPTIMRNLGVGSSNVPAGVALMLVPYLWNLADMNTNMPMGVLGFFGIIGGASVLLLPDTDNLADTLNDIE
ncbi:organic cation transporter protein isoform X2 [Nilaparvata lugens]|uniref:organic cation transporter protein isoform X2 n=1 Tax=Nilaparvata lugens TaxID=108931 RepID=UPI000B987C19|nr:organic cation transporter protein isoform X2 [Nilaparvata lugens]